MAAESKNNAAAVHPGPHHRRRRRYVLLFPLPYQGHINPMFHLAGLLHGHGFTITIFHHAHFNAPDPSRHPQYRFVPVPDNVTTSSPPTSVAIEDIVAHILALGNACELGFRDRLAAVLAEYSVADDGAAWCLVADAHLLPVLKVAKSMSLPTLALRTGSAASYACFAAYPMLCARGYLPVQDSRQLDTPVPELPPFRVRDLMQIGKAGHGLMREMMARAVTAVEDHSSGLILNTFDALERDELQGLRRRLPATVPVFDVGPLHKQLNSGSDGDGENSSTSSSSLLRQDRACLEWLDTWPPCSVLYVSFGSLACMTPRDLAETAWGIAASAVPFLWVVRPNLVVPSDDQHNQNTLLLPEGFEAATRGRGKVVSWAAQEEVLAHGAVGGFWTHCGWNSTAESVCEGVPMLCRPCFGDQPGNARYVEHVWRVGFEVGVGGEIERGEVEKAVRRLMSGSEGDEVRDRAAELKKKAAECTGEDGSSCLAVDKLVEHIMSLSTRNDSRRGERFKF